MYSTEIAVKKKSKVAAIRAGQPAECVHHGFHSRWRIHTGNNVRCNICSEEWAKRYCQVYPLRRLLIDAKGRGMEFDLDEDFLKWLLEKQGNCCALSGIPFDPETKPSLDRINPNRGYTRDNVQLVIFEINRMKTNLSQERFVELCKAVGAKS